ncbi:MAG: serine/threonine protein kinase [Candidatus Obscuribacterales bacterium]|nr:serine/threonine protein kinase [Candidatus Obscuribacterales bacterium]
MTNAPSDPTSNVSITPIEKLGPGFIINESYILLKELGRGGKATVYLARDLELGEELAIKIMHNHVSSDPASHERFKREAKISAGLQHKYIMRVKAFGMTAEAPFLIMEYVRGITLEQYLRSVGILPLSQAMAMFLALAEALAYAHDQQVLHRDLKPANIMLEDDNPECPKLVDFGLAKVLEAEAYDKQATTTVGIAGSPAYMSPEQCRGESLDARSDIYSLAVIMFEALTGKRPFDGETELAVMAMHLNDIPTFPSKEALPEEIQAIILKCLSKDPLNRLQTARDLLSQVGQLDTTRIKQWTAPTQTSERNTQQKRYLIYLTFAVLIAVVTTLWILRNNEIAKTASTNPLKQEKQALPTHTLGMEQRSPADLAQAATHIYTKNGNQDPKGEVERLFIAALKSAERKRDWTVLPRIQGAYANYLLSRKQLDKAQYYATAALHSLNTGNCSPNVRFEVFRFAARVFGARGDTAKAQGYYEKALESLKDEYSTKIGYRQAILMEDMADFYHNSHKQKEELEALQASIDADPADLLQYTRRCLQLAERTQDLDSKRFQHQLECYERFRHHPVRMTYDPLMKIAKRCYKKHQFKEATKIAQYALDDIRREQDPSKLRNEYAAMLVLLVQACAASNDIPASVRYRDEALSKYREYLNAGDLKTLTAITL